MMDVILWGLLCLFVAGMLFAGGKMLAAIWDRFTRS